MTSSPSALRRFGRSSVMTQTRPVFSIPIMGCPYCWREVAAARRSKLMILGQRRLMLD
jgi:hypothetical protein